MRRYKLKPSKPIPRWPTPAELARFLKFVKLGPVPPKGPGVPRTRCWLWQGFCDEHGYGRFWYAGSSHWANRLTYQFFKYRKIKPGNEANHKCHVPGCVNPTHIEQTSKGRNSALANMRHGYRGNGRTRPVPDDDIPF
jgi:hypothetical protein